MGPNSAPKWVPFTCRFPAEHGDFEEAVRYQQQSLDLLQDQDRPRWQANFEKRLELYKTGRKYDRSSFWGLPTEDLVAWWKLDAGGGDIAADSSGNALHGTLVGGPRWETGQLGGALFLEGGAADNFQYVRCGNSPALNIADAITLSGWMKVDRFVHRWEPLISTGCWGLRQYLGTDRMLFQVVVAKFILWATV